MLFKKNRKSHRERCASFLSARPMVLLETAKHAVEIAIETDEQTAMAYINDQTGE